MDYLVYKMLLYLTAFVFALAGLFLLMIPLSLVWSAGFLILGWYFGPLFVLALPVLFWVLAQSRDRRMDIVQFLGR